MLGTGWSVLANFLQFLDPVYDEFCSSCNGENGQHNAGCTAPQLHQVPIWPLDSDDSKKLGVATAAYLETMPSKSKIRELLEKHLPLFIFAGTIAEVFGPRAQFSVEKKRKAYLAKLEAANSRGRFGAPGNVRPGSQTHGQSASAEGAPKASSGYDAAGGTESRVVTDAFAVNA